MWQSFLAILIGKLILFGTRFLKFGGGSAAPGLYALKIDPNLVSKLASQIPNNIVITGTNGKTTTAKMLTHFAIGVDQKVLRNATGSNLERGIASALVKHTNIFGQIDGVDLAIWEVDEAAFNKVLPKLKPSLIVILNVFRDQLDRYGEVDTVVKNWAKSLKKISWDCQILLNSGDPNLIQLKDSYSNVSLFQVKGHLMNFEKKQLGNLKINSNFEAEIIKDNGLDGSEFLLSYPGGERKVHLSIPGVYHIYDFLAAFSVYFELNLPVDQLYVQLESYQPAFGRVEKLDIKGKSAIMFLIKNPAGATVVFETIQPSIKKDDVFLIALNDNFADGLDVSWIWDAPFEALSVKGPLRRASEASKGVRVICSGTRAEDLAVRLKYAGFEDIQVEKDLAKTLDRASMESQGRIFILPTYTAMLELQKILANMGIKKHYWKDE